MTCRQTKAISHGDGRLRRRTGMTCAGWVLAVFALAIRPICAQVPGAFPPTGAVQTLNPLSSLDAATLDAFKGRPLFAPSRRSPPPRQALATPPPPVAVEAPPPNLRLVGIVSGVDNAVAILRNASGGPSLSLKVGDVIETWRVQTIGPDRVTLREGARELTYRLFAIGSSQGTGSQTAKSLPIGVSPQR